MDESVALAYYHERGLPVTIARLFRTAGAHQTGHQGMVIPSFVPRALDARGEILDI